MCAVEDAVEVVGARARGVMHPEAALDALDLVFVRWRHRDHPSLREPARCVTHDRAASYARLVTARRRARDSVTV